MAYLYNSFNVGENVWLICITPLMLGKMYGLSV